jgi:hypothetical protein
MLGLTGGLAGASLYLLLAIVLGTTIYSRGWLKKWNWMGKAAAIGACGFGTIFGTIGGFVSGKMSAIRSATAKDNTGTTLWRAFEKGSLIGLISAMIGAAVGAGVGATIDMRLKKAKELKDLRRSFDNFDKLRREEQKLQESEMMLRMNNRVEQANWERCEKEWYQLRVKIAENELKSLEGKEVLDPNTLAELKRKEEQAEMRVPPSGTNELWQRWQRVEAENNERRRKAGDELRAQLKAEGRSVSYRIFEYAVTSRLGSEVEQVEQMRMAWNRMKEEKNEKEAA